MFPCKRFLTFPARFLDSIFAHLLISIRYVMILNACISSFYILIGTFNALITFIGNNPVFLSLL
jgi:hypothetical protein